MNSTSNHDAVVFVVDDQASIRKAVKSMLEAAGYNVETFSRASEFLDNYKQTSPACLVLDVRMPGMNGLELQQHLIKNQILLPVIILTGHGDIPMAVTAMESGAVSFLEKPADAGALIEKVGAAVEFDRQYHRRTAERNEILLALDKLTPREREVMDLLVDGKKPRTIAMVLGITQSTIRVQRATILKKMQADSVTDLLRMMQLIRQDTELPDIESL